MALTKEQIKEIEQASAKYMYYHRPPLEVRDQLDFGYRIEDQNVYLFEIRPRWDKPEEKTETPVAKTTYIKSKDLWKIYWMRGNLKWYHYEPVPFVKTISDFFDLVAADEDKTGRKSINSAGDSRQSIDNRRNDDYKSHHYQ